MGEVWGGARTAPQTGNSNRRRKAAGEQERLWQEKQRPRGGREEGRCRCGPGSHGSPVLPGMRLGCQLLVDEGRQLRLAHRADLGRGEFAVLE
jgi:hypothetical protein